MEVIKDQFLDTANHYAELGEHGEQYAALLTFAALEPGDTFSKQELATATQALPAAGLQHAAHALSRALKGAGEQRREYWRNRMLPYLKTIWPKTRELITPSISGRLAGLCVAAQEVFPEAVNELRHWLQEVEHPDYIVHLLHEAKLPEKHPESALVFLDAVVGENDFWLPSDLNDCLIAIRSAMHEVSTDPRFLRLQEQLRRRG
jgi:hypothetical protein